MNPMEQAQQAQDFAHWRIFTESHDHLIQSAREILKTLRMGHCLPSDYHRQNAEAVLERAIEFAAMVGRLYDKNDRDRTPTEDAT